VPGKLVELTKTEWGILHFLVENRDQLVTAQMILEHVWGTEHALEYQYLHTYMNRLRKKLHDSTLQPRYIKTRHGHGFVFIATPLE
jgi:DNA-binding response OmpR family regulator